MTRNILLPHTALLRTPNVFHSKFFFHIFECIEKKFFKYYRMFYQVPLFLIGISGNSKSGIHPNIVIFFELIGIDSSLLFECFYSFLFNIF